MPTLTFRFTDIHNHRYAILGRMVENGLVQDRTNLSVDSSSLIYDPLALTITADFNGHKLPDRVSCLIPGVKEITFREGKTTKTVFGQAELSVIETAVHTPHLEAVA